MMDNNHLLEILYGVFAKDTNSFLNFVLIEKDIAISCENTEKDYHFAEISTQLDFIYKKNRRRCPQSIFSKGRVT